MHRLKFKVNEHTWVYGMGIYAIVCIPTGKMYIGQTRTRFLNRWLDHQWALLHNRHNPYFQNVCNKYGIENFECKVIEYISFYDEHLFNEHETYWIKHFRKILGNKHVLNSNDGGTGMNPTLERRAQMSAIIKERMNLPEHRYMVRDSFRRYMDDPKNRENFRRKQKERSNTPEEREARSERMTEYWKDENRRKRMSDIQKESYSSKPERKTKQSRAQKETWKDPNIRHARIEGMKTAFAKRPKKPKKVRTQEEILEAKRIGNEKRRASMDKFIHTSEYAEMQRQSQKRRLEDPEKLARLLEGQKKAAQIRKERNDKLRWIADAILVWHYIDYPEDRNLSLMRKKMLINQLAQEKHWFIS